MIKSIEQGKINRDKILNAIEEYIKKYGYSPTVRDLCNIVGLKSSATIHRNLKVLKEEGKINWNPTMSRTIQIVKDSI